MEIILFQIDRFSLTKYTFVVAQFNEWKINVRDIGRITS